MIREILNLDFILQRIEKLLHIVPTCESLTEQLTVTRSLLQNEWQTPIPPTGIPGLAGYDSVETFLAHLNDSLREMALLVNIETFDGICGQTLKDVNYLGGQENKLVNSFKILTKKDLVHRKIEFIEDLLKSFSALQVCELRRIVCIIGVLSDLNLPEAASIFANHIVLGAYI